ncbi:MAG TPA: HAMP domain-containing protein [Lysobacter sp.]
MRFGLREKVLAFLIGGFALIGAATLVVVDTIQERQKWALAEEAAERFVLLHKERLLSGIQGDLALAQKMADSEALRRWVVQPDPSTTPGAMRELDSLTRLVSSHAVFIASRPAAKFYFVDQATVASARASGVDLRASQNLSEQNPDDAWFYSTLRQAEPYNFNIDHNADLNATKLWINVVMNDGDAPVGVVGTGIDLTAFIDAFVKTGEPGVSAMFIDAQGAIQGHSDPNRIALNAPVGTARADSAVWKLLPDPDDVAALRAAMATLQAGTRESASLPLTLDGKRHVAALAYVPQMRWFALSIHDASKAAGAWQQAPIMAVLVATLIALAAGVAVLGNRLVFTPLQQLERAAHRVAEGDYDVRLDEGRDDEVGAVSRSFNRMTERLAQMERLVKANVATITAKLQRAESFDELAGVLLSSIAPLLDLGQGSCYRLSHDRKDLLLCGSYARLDAPAPRRRIAFGDGLLGQCAREQRAITLDDPPEGYLRIGSALGESAAAVVVLRPLVNIDTLVGVLELAMFKPPGEAEHALLDGLLPVMATCIAALEHKQHLQQVLSTAQQHRSQLEQQQEALDQQRASLQNLLDRSPVCTAFTANGVFRYANPAFQQVFGLHQGEPATSVYNDPGERTDILAALQKHGEIRGREMRLVTADGTVREFLATFINFRHEGEDGVMGWLTDITGRGSPAPGDDSTAS